MFVDEKPERVVLLLFYSCFLFSTYQCVPLSVGVASSTLGSTSNSGPLFNVTRVFNSGDVFSNADPRCDAKTCSLMGGTVVRSSPCHCQCPNRAPAFLQHVRQCANSLEECKMVAFNQSGTRQAIPTLFLPLIGQSVAPSSPIDWRDAGIRTESNGSVACSVTGCGYLTQNGWAQLDRDGIFSLMLSSGHTSLQWLGSKQDQMLLTGKIVQVTIRCATDFCLAFRVIGKDAVPPLMDASNPIQAGASVGANSAGTNERANQLGLIVGIVCGALLAVTLVSVAVFWTVCWKQQKERLARKIQLHLLYQQQRMQQQAAASAFPHLANALNAMNEPAVASTIEMLQNYGGVAYAQYVDSSQQQGWLEAQQQRQNEELARRYLVEQGGGLLVPSNSSSGVVDPRSIGSPSDQLILPPPPPYPHARKKLYFSPEFFEPDLMVDPPPVAEEFLYEVRRMIDLAKNRIRSRRYMPSLLVIPEEGANRSNANNDLGGISSSSSMNSLGGSGGRTGSMLERRDSFSKMAQEPAPEETLTIQEVEHGRDQADSPHCSQGSSGSSGDGGPGDRSSGETGSGAGRHSVDSGLGGDADCSPAKDTGGDKVTHWLSRLPPTLEMEENDNRQHSKLYSYFNARQRLAQQNTSSNIIRVQVNEESAGGSQMDSSPSSHSTASSLDVGSSQKRRHSVPVTEDSPGPAFGRPTGLWQYRRPEISGLAPATAAYFERQERMLRSRMQRQDEYGRDHVTRYNGEVGTHRNTNPVSYLDALPEVDYDEKSEQGSPTEPSSLENTSHHAYYSYKPDQHQAV